jgi:hypothetical protein
MLYKCICSFTSFIYLSCLWHSSNKSHKWMPTVALPPSPWFTVQFVASLMCPVPDMFNQKSVPLEDEIDIWILSSETVLVAICWRETLPLPLKNVDRKVTSLPNHQFPSHKNTKCKWSKNQAPPNSQLFKIQGWNNITCGYNGVQVQDYSRFRKTISNTWPCLEIGHTPKNGHVQSQYNRENDDKPW